MKRIGWMLAALVLTAGMAQGQPRPQSVPDVVPVLAKACLPLLNGGTLPAAIAAAQAQGFKVTAEIPKMVTVEREKLSLTLSSGYCALSLRRANTASFPRVSAELGGWLPTLGRYWQGPIGTDALGLNGRKYRAGGHTISVDEVVDEEEQLLTVNIAK